MNKDRILNIVLAVLAVTVLVHRLTGWDNALIMIPLFAVIVGFFVWTHGDGRRALEANKEDALSAGNDEGRY